MPREKMYCVSILGGRTFWLIEGDTKLNDKKKELDSYYLSYEVEEVRDDKRSRCIEFKQST
jgi:hypothetical protein